MKLSRIFNLFLLILFISNSINVFSQNLPTEVKSAIEGKDDNAKLDILIDFGKSYFKKYDYKTSAECYKAAGVIYNSGGLKDGEAYCLNKAGKSYLKGKKYDDAIKVFSKAKTNYKSLNDNKNYFNVTFNIGDAYSFKGNYSNAIKNYKEGYNIIKNTSDYENQAYILNQIGTTYSTWGKKKEAYNYFEQALEKANKGNLKTLAANIEANLKTAAWNKASKKEKQQIKEKEDIEQKQIVENLQENIKLTKQENLLSLEEIDKLSFEMQAKELKLHVLQDQYEKQLMENEIKESNIKLLKAQNNLKKIEIRENKAKIANQRKILIIIAAGLAITSILLLFIIVLYRQKRKNLIIVRKQKEEINQTNIILSQANEEIEAQRDELEAQRDMLDRQNKEITSSILYAEKIQNSILPSKERISKYISNFFILFKPKDIVSGDFYWFYRKGDDYWGAVVDCTGHGVPGAFMSMIGNSLLNKIILEDETTGPAILLEKLNKELKYALNQSKSKDASDDGMDMTVVKMNLKDKKLSIALANHTAIVVRDNKAEIIEGDIFSIGGMFSEMENLSFTDQEIDISEGTSIYMFSDGYQDQFGGDNNKKYGQERLKNKILEIQDKPMLEQHEILEKEIEDWEGMNNQIDDILLVGVEF